MPLEALAFDIRLAVRGLRRDWSYALASLAMLALALALNVTVFTVMDAMLFRGFPLVQRTDRLVFLQEPDRLGRCCISYADAADWQTQARSFQDLALIGATSVAFRDEQGRPMDLRVTTASVNLFRLLGVSPAMGRDFLPSDAAAGAPPVVMLTHRLWQARFAARPDVVGSHVRIDGVAAEIVGVMPEGLEFPSAAADGLWMPIVSTPALARRGLTPGGFIAVGRLRDGVSSAQARAELETINRGLADAYPDTNRSLGLKVMDYAEFNSGVDARIIWGSLWAGACLVLLIACANVANLTLVRTVGRGREFGTCLALGAGRRRLVRQILVEAAILSIGAALAAWEAIRWCTTLWAVAAASPHQVVDYTANARTLGYLAAATLVAATLLALAPALRVLQLSAGGTLPTEARGATQGPRTRRLVTALVAGQMALAIVLLASSGVLVRSFANVVGADTGVRQPASILVGRLRLPSETYPTPQSRLAYLDRVQDRLRTVAGIEQPSLSNGLPVKFAGFQLLEIEGQPSKRGEEHSALSVAATPHYFDVLGARVLAGRDFTDDDRDASTPVAIVNARFAALHFHGTSPVGQRIRAVERDGAGPWRVIVGVASNVMNGDALRQQFQPAIYVPLRQAPPARSAFFLARTSFAAAAAVRSEIAALDPDVTLDDFDSLQNLFAFDRDNMDAGHSELGKYSKAAPTFALVALLLAAAGLVAVIVHSVAQRTREIGVRMAIGAAARDIRRLILREGMRPVMIGLVAGLTAALAINRVLQSQLVGVSPYDPLVFTSAPVLLALIGLAACQIPVRRALHVDPAVTLRHE